MRPHTPALWTLAFAFLAGVLLLFYQAPIAFLHLMAEDYYAEYATATAFATAGILLLGMASTLPREWRRHITVGIALVALFFAAEEISWGQRIFGIETPESFRAINRQSELTVHNIEALDRARKWVPLIMGTLCLGATGVSVIINARRPDLRRRAEALGLPILTAPVIPLVLVSCFFFLSRATPEHDEIGELALGLAALAWVLDRVLDRHWERRPGTSAAMGSIRATLLIVVSLAFVAASATVLTLKRPGRLSWWATKLAKHYATHGMYEHAETTFAYIYSHPKWVRPETRLAHARMLLESDRPTAARELLAVELEELDAAKPDAKARGEHWRHLHAVHTLLDRTDEARDALRTAIAVDESALQQAGDGDERASRLLSLSMSLELAGRHEEAYERAVEGFESAESAGIRLDLESRLSELEDKLDTETPRSR